MESVDRLTELFRRFPGIGPRQAKRFVYFLLTEKPAYSEELAKSITSLKDSVRECPECHRFFSSKADSKDGKCSICKSSGRDHTLLLVVEKDADLEAMEKSKSYNGLYFVLGGTSPLMEEKKEGGNGGRIRTKELADRVSTEKDLSEVILAFSITTEGEHTAENIESLLRPVSIKNKFKITVLGRGLSTGSELEYSDSDTLKSALKNRV